MQETLISFETAKLAKEKGLLPKDGELGYFYIPSQNDDEEDSWSTDVEIINFTINNYLPAYTQSLLQKWLREKHDIEVYVRSSVDLYNKKYWTTFLPNGCLENKNNTYEKALEIGLQEGLKLIK